MNRDGTAECDVAWNERFPKKKKKKNNNPSDHRMNV
jgi:hypothetical protein